MGGNAVTKVSFRAAGGTCDGGGISLLARTTQAASYISSTVGRDSDPANPLQTDLGGSDVDPGDTFDLLVGDDGGTNHVELAHSAPDGSVVTGSLDTDEGTPDCLVVGFLTSG